jgi:DNA-binding HxlR family transcriptional regulator
VPKRDYQGQNCSIAGALEVVGERWTLLVVRDVFLGLHRFEQLQESLGFACNVLTDRLNRLLEEGILERVPYNERPERFEYRLTKKGRELQIALVGPRQWGDKYVSEKPPRLFRRKLDKKPVVAALVPRAQTSSPDLAHRPRFGVTGENLITRHGEVGPRCSQPSPALLEIVEPRRSCNCLRVLGRITYKNAWEPVAWSFS